MNTIVFTHILNEEDLLPEWLEHHKKLFDHGVIIDYGSTDNSLSIIKNICPTWEIVKNTEPFGSCVNDIEKQESRFHGWKIALTITEFIFIDDLKKFIIDFELKYPEKIGIRLRSAVLVDLDDIDLRENIPILKKHIFGYFEEDTEKFINKKINYKPQKYVNEKSLIKLTAINIHIGIDGRYRLLHKSIKGKYTQGRHGTYHANIFPRSIGFCKESEIIVCWLGYAPLSLYKKRIKNMNRPRQIHFNLDTLLYYQRQKSYNLLKDPNYKKIYEKLFGDN